MEAFEFWKDFSLIRKVRRAMSDAAGGGVASGHPAGLERDLAGLSDRLERLRRSFPGAPGLLARVELSPHVTSLLGDVPATPLLGCDEGPAR